MHINDHLLVFAPRATLHVAPAPTFAGTLNITNLASGAPYRPVRGVMNIADIFLLASTAQVIFTTEDTEDTEFFLLN